MSHKRYYLVLALVLLSSVILLGLSYSSNSGNDKAILNENITDDMRVVYSDGNEILSGETTEIGITNLTEDNKKYRIFIKEIIGETKNTYYQINNEEKRLLDSNTIIIDDINSYGTNGDYKYNKITLYGDNSSIKYIVDVMYDESDGEL